MIAGFEHPTSGRVVIAGRDVTLLKPQKREVGMVFQNYALFPHLSVWDNVEFGLRSRGVSRADAKPRVERALALVELDGYGGRKVQALSGGQQQRVALARALAPEPPLLLLDEPLSNLDAALRERTRAELRALLKRLGMTAVFVTHDQEEAFALSDRIAVLSRGELQQLGTPEELYARPVNPFVAGFLGRANFIPGVVEGVEGDTLACRLGAGPLWRAHTPPGVGLAVGMAVRLMARPETLHVSRDVEGAEALEGRVVDRRFAGALSFYTIAVDGGAEVLAQGDAAAASTGDAVRVTPAPGAMPLAFAAEP
jgi:iron(III) transport system ATP-binding protein